MIPVVDFSIDKVVWLFMAVCIFVGLAFFIHAALLTCENWWRAFGSKVNMDAKKVLTLNLDKGLQADIAEMKRLIHCIDEREFEASQNENFEIDYTDFPEYTKAHNLKSKVRDQLANIAVEELGIPL